MCAVNTGRRAVSEADALDRSSSGSSGHDPYHPEAPPHHYGIIVCAMRYFLPSFSPYYEAFCEVHKGEDLSNIWSGKCSFGDGGEYIERETKVPLWL